MRKQSKKPFNWSKFWANVIVGVGIYLSFAIPVCLIDWIANL